jgi:hypothetical protein
MRNEDTNIMTDKYWVSHFAELRQDQLIIVPREYAIHTDFRLLGSEEEVRAAFSRLYALYFQIYGGMAQSPEEFGVPLFSKDEYRNFSQQGRDSAWATYRPFVLLYNLFTCGEIDGCSIRTSIEKYRAVKPRLRSESNIDERLTNTHLLFQKLTDCGFIFEGLKNNKSTDKDIIISYPDDTTLLHLWKMLADKTKNIDCIHDFMHCSFRLLQDDMHTKGYSDFEGFIDTFPLESEKAFITEMDKALTSMGLISGRSGRIGCYYRTESAVRQKSPPSFRIVNVNGYNPWHSEIKPEKAELGLRIRNVDSCMAYLATCPDSVKRIFTEKNDSGCGRHADNTCKHGVGYEIDGKAYWRCGCCDPAIRFERPNIEDISHYIKLVELGEKR